MPKPLPLTYLYAKCDMLFNWQFPLLLHTPRYCLTVSKNFSTLHPWHLFDTNLPNMHFNPIAYLPGLLLIPEVGQCLQAEDEDGQHNDHDTDDGDDACARWGLGVLEQHPQSFLDLVRRKRALLLFWKTFVLVKAVHDVLSQIVEHQLVHEDVQGDVRGPPKLPARLVKIQNGVEAGAVSVQEELVPKRVKVAWPAHGVTEQGVRILGHGAKLSFIPHPWDVDGQSLAQRPSTPP